jgi:hypothetical protein
MIRRAIGPGRSGRFLLDVLDMADRHAQQPASAPQRAGDEGGCRSLDDELSNWGRWQRRSAGRPEPHHGGETSPGDGLAKTGIVVSLERPIVPSKAPDDTKADGKPHGVAFFDIRFKTFPPAIPAATTGSAATSRNRIYTADDASRRPRHDSSDGKRATVLAREREPGDRLHEARTR